ncbi:Tol-Pal system protein TolB [subsurface metagenome]
MKKIPIEQIVKIPSYTFYCYRGREEIFFASDKDGPSKVYQINPETLEYQEYTTIPNLTTTTNFIWWKKGEEMIVNKDKDGDERFNVYLYNTKEQTETTLIENEKSIDFICSISPNKESLLISSDQNGPSDLYTLNVETKEKKQITFHKYPCGEGFWCENGLVYYHSNDTENRKNRDIYEIKSGGTEQRKIISLSSDSADLLYETSRDGELLLLSSDVEGITKIGLYNTTKEELTWLSKTEYDEIPVNISLDKKKILALRDSPFRRYIVIYDIETGDEEIPELEGQIYSTKFCYNDKYLIYSRSDPTSPGILALYDLENKKEIPIIKEFAGFTKEDFVKAEKVQYKTFDGEKLNAVLYKPERESGKKYPAVILAPGGPGGRLTLSFYGFGQVLVSEGFVVMSPHIRGSYGYGREFRETIIKDIGGIDGKDYVYAKKYLESLDFVDSNKIGIFGGSYGGYMTNLQLTKYAEVGWNAGASSVGITHWKNMYDKSVPGFKLFIEYLFGTYEENKELYEDRSPLNFVENIKAPILIIQSINDMRCPVEEARNFKEKLLKIGKKEGEDFEYLEDSGKGHLLIGQDSLIRQYTLTLDFFKRKFLED